MQNENIEFIKITFNKELIYFRCWVTVIMFYYLAIKLFYFLSSFYITLFYINAKRRWLVTLILNHWFYLLLVALKRQNLK